MKKIYLGFYDYFNDIRHDRLLKKVTKIGCRMMDRGVYGEDWDSELWFPAEPLKEGSLFHYIKQRRKSNEKKTKTHTRS